MTKPKFIYVVFFRGNIERGYFYDELNAEEAILSMAEENGYDRYNLYFEHDPDGRAIWYLYSRGIGSDEELGGIAVCVMSDADEGEYTEPETYYTVESPNDIQPTRNRIFTNLWHLRNIHPDQMIVMETPNGTVECKLGDASVYEDMDGLIVIDAE